MAPTAGLRSYGTEADEPTLREFISVLSRRKRVIGVFVLITVVVALGCSLLQLNVYSTDARILIEQQASQQVINGNNQPLVVDRQRVIETEVRIITSEAVRRTVVAQFGSGTPVPSVSAVPGTDLVSVSVRSTDPALAAAVANATARAYISYRESSTKADLSDASVVLQRQLDDLQRQIHVLDERSRATHGSAQSAALLAQQAAITQYDVLKQQADALNVQASITGSNATLVGPASVPTSPTSPKPVNAAILAILVGGLFGAVMAYVVEFFDDRLESQAALEQLLPDIPVLGLVPVYESWAERTETHVATLEVPEGAVAEAYRSLRVALQFVDGHGRYKVIQVTSSIQGEGKSATAINLAVMYSLAGLNTVLVDADLRRPRVHRFVGISNNVGLSTALLKDLPLSEVLHDVSGDRLRVVPAGPTPTFPAELLQSPASERFFAKLREVADIVIIDTPPVLPVADPLAVSAHADAVLLVVSAQRSLRRNVQRSAALLGTVAANVVGVVLNEASDSASGAERYAAYTAEDLTTRRRIEKLFRPDQPRPDGPAPAPSGPAAAPDAPASAGHPGS